MKPAAGVGQAAWTNWRAARLSRAAGNLGCGFDQVCGNFLAECVDSDVTIIWYADVEEYAFFVLLSDKGYNADAIRADLAGRNIEAVIPGRSNRRVKIEHDRTLYKQRNRIETMFGRLKDWRRVATRYDRCPKAFFSAVALAATVIFWL